MSDITLSAASRTSLLALQATQTNVDKTNNRLSTGLKVGSAIDDAVAYFQAKALSDRADDLTARKDKIDQGISALKVTVGATTSAATLIKNLKGILDAARSQNDSQRAASQKQMTQLIYQVDKLVRDASYQGLNLLNSSTSTLSVYFSEKTDSKLDVKGANILASKLYVMASNGAALGIQTSKAGANGSALTTINTSSLLGISKSLSQFQISIVSNQNQLNSRINVAIGRLDATLASLNAKASNFGTSVSILSTRLDFTKDYVNNLTEGAGKLTLADTNEEGANLLALQTRQQLGIKTLSFAGQSEQSVLRLFG
jgi:flagellin-like hook-associated protein FlgL